MEAEKLARDANGHRYCTSWPAYDGEILGFVYGDSGGQIVKLEIF
jgi:hypothetical protein